MIEKVKQRSTELIKQNAELQKIREERNFDLGNEVQGWEKTVQRLRKYRDLAKAAHEGYIRALNISERKRSIKE